MYGLNESHIEDVKVELLWHQKLGLQYTATGYGGKIPTRYKIKLFGNPRWYRVYCAIFSNAGTLYIVRGKVPPGHRYLMENTINDGCLSLMAQDRGIS